MTLAIRNPKREQAAHRFLLWMGIGTAFIAALIALDYFGAISIP